METTFVIKESDLNTGFMEAIKKLFQKKGQLQITITDYEDFDLYKSETPEEFISRINQRTEELEAGKNTVSFDTESFDSFVKERL
ncbi:MAG: hypothetical protein QM564_11375 [Bergeyella sp.]